MTVVVDVVFVDDDGHVIDAVAEAIVFMLILLLMLLM